MALDLNGENILVSGIAGRGEINTVIEDDVIVPDSKPDVGRILVADADILIGNAEADRDKATVSGIIRYKIIYMPEDRENDIRNIVSDMPFSRDINVPGAEAGMGCTADCRVEHIECAIANSRKLNLRSFLRFTCKVNKEKSIKAVSDMRGADDIQLLREEYDIKRFLGTARESFIVGQTLEVPVGNRPVFEILRTDVETGGLTVEPNENKVVLRGDIIVSNLYSAEDAEESIQHMEHEIPFTHYIDLPGVDRGSVCTASCRILDYKCTADEDINNEMRLVNVEVELAAEVEGAAESKIDLITDAYSPSKDIRLIEDNIQLEGFGGRSASKLPFREVVTIGSGQPAISRVYYIIARPVLSEYAVSDGKLTVEGLVECNVIYCPEDGEVPICCQNYEIPFRHEMDSAGSREGDDCEINLRVDHCGYSILSSEELEIRITMSIDAATTRVFELPVIAAAEEEELSQEYKKPSVLLYFARKGDTLWSIAKKYRTTVSDIMDCNNIDEDDDLAAGQQILIP